jgi:hypothetical protein
MDKTVLETWAKRADLRFGATGEGIVHGWGDMETVFEVHEDETGYAVVTRDRGVRRTVATFGTQDEADTLLLLLLGRTWLANRGVNVGFGTDAAPGTSIDEADRSYRVTDGSGRVSIFASRTEAAAYSLVAGKSASDIEAWLNGRLTAR